MIYCVKCLSDVKKYYIIHLLDSAEPDIRFVVQIEDDVGRSKAVLISERDAILDGTVYLGENI